MTKVDIRIYEPVNEVSNSDHPLTSAGRPSHRDVPVEHLELQSAQHHDRQTPPLRRWKEVEQRKGS